MFIKNSEIFELVSVPGNILGLFQEDLSQFWLNLKNKMIFREEEVCF
jgi:hypothetical protein